MNHSVDINMYFGTPANLSHSNYLRTKRFHFYAVRLRWVISD